jgi:hypothetical protein
MQLGAGVVAALGLVMSHLGFLFCITEGTAVVALKHVVDTAGTVVLAVAGGNATYRRPLSPSRLRPVASLGRVRGQEL